MEITGCVYCPPIVIGCFDGCPDGYECIREQLPKIQHHNCGCAAHYR
ncbi:14128_t:CDS:2 [Dentiscutata heterogama]|uniref:14128_t:CDS:1 n=1 Tax=Dentiscutata heterogama TaxID=1316150 RepID=A0ACA9KP43_9GLOM|nr:14128_t:CDS:2 [Dentiscutata heterogama]